MGDIFSYLKETLHIDPVIVLIVIASGFFQNTYLKLLVLSKDDKTNSALKTLAVSGVVSLVYLALVGLPKDSWANYFLSYFLATSLYELLIRPITKAIKKALGDKDSDG